MRTLRLAVPGLLALMALGACQTTTTQPGEQPRLMARATDTALNNRGVLRDERAAIAIDPDGCMVWIIDDGIEGYSSRRVDPRTGLPVCTSAVPPGSVIGNPQTTAFPDFLP